MTNASGFFFERDERLFLTTSRHVLVDEPTGHYPNRLEIERSALPETTVYRAFTPIICTARPTQSRQAPPF